MPGKNNVADYLSRIPGMEELEMKYIASKEYTLNLCNICDVMDTTRPKSVAIHSIITIFDESSFLKSILKS